MSVFRFFKMCKCYQIAQSISCAYIDILESYLALLNLSDMIKLSLLKVIKIQSKNNYTQLKGKKQVFCSNRENLLYLSALQSLHALCQISVRQAVESHTYSDTGSPKITPE